MAMPLHVLCQPLWPPSSNATHLPCPRRRTPQIILYTTPSADPIFITTEEQLVDWIRKCRAQFPSIVPAPMRWNGQGEPEVR